MKKLQAFDFEIYSPTKETKEHNFLEALFVFFLVMLIVAEIADIYMQLNNY